MSCPALSVHVGTCVTAPPGAEMLTPTSPSKDGLGANPVSNRPNGRAAGQGRTTNKRRRTHGSTTCTAARRGPRASCNRPSSLAARRARRHLRGHRAGHAWWAGRATAAGPPVVPPGPGAPMMAAVVPPGQPTVERAGPLLPAEARKTMPCSYTTSLHRSTKRLAADVSGLQSARTPTRQAVYPASGTVQASP